ncbi:F-box and WD-40 domain protein 7 [Nematocida sp. ERTm5]|nr:F-box and WD-40 domain protein 7 [Nematocida sp. ERTm5]
MGIIRSIFPLEVLIRITQYLSIKDIKRLMCASDGIRKAIEANPIIWKQKLKERERDCTNGNYLVEVKKECILTHSWIKNINNSSNSIKHIPNCEITKIAAYGDMIVVSSNSTHLYILDKSLGYIRKLKQAKGSIWTFDYANNVLVSGSTDKSVRVWDIFLGISIKTLSEHKSTVRTVLLADKYVISGSRDSTIRVWDLNTGGVIHALKRHTGSIRDMVTVKNKPLLISGSYDGTCILWNYRTGEGIRYLIKLSRRIYKVQCIGDWVAVGGMDQKMHVVTLDGNHVFSSAAQNGTIFQIKTDSEQYVYTLTANGTVSKWNVKKKEQIYQIDTHTKAIDIYIINHLLVVGLIDRIDLYCREKGIFIRTVAAVDMLYSVYCDNTVLIYGYKDNGLCKLTSIQYKNIL